MLLDILKKGSLDRSVLVRIIDSVDGTPETAVVFNTSGIDMWYRREGAARVAITEVTLAALTTAHADGGFLHVSDGYYRIDLPDAAFATGANYVDFGGVVTGMVVIGGRVRLVDVDLESTSFGLNLSSLTIGTVTTVSDKTGYALAADFRIKKNTALNNFTFLMLDTSGNAAAGLTVTAQRSLDGGALAAMANSVAAISNGLYKINLATADTNADFCCYRFTAAGAQDRIVAFPTQTE